jgi:hypothetical protein
MTARSSAWALTLVFCAMGCSSSSPAPGAKPSGDDDSNTDSGGSNEPSDAGAKGDSTVPGKDGGDDTTSPRDGGSEAAAANNAAGDAGAAQFCTSFCAGLTHCFGSCSNCSAGDTNIRSAAYASNLTACVGPAIEGLCSDAGAAVQNCQIQAAAATTATPVGSKFCQNLEFTFCSDPNCLADFSSYSDNTISSFSSCNHDLPDASVDGGCNGFYTCIGTILSQ